MSSVEKCRSLRCDRLAIKQRGDTPRWPKPYLLVVSLGKFNERPVFHSLRIRGFVAFLTIRRYSAQEKKNGHMAETLENIMTFWPSLRYLIRSPFLFTFPLEFFPIFSPCYSIFVVGSEDECRDTSSGHPPASLDRRIRWTSRTRPLKVPATTGRLSGPAPLLVCRVSNSSGGCSTRYAGSLN